MALPHRFQRGFFLLLALVIVASAVWGQQPNTSVATMTFDGQDGPPYPVQAQVLTPTSAMAINVSGTQALAPFVLFAAPTTLPAGIVVTPTLTVDINPALLSVIINGTLADPFNSMAVLNSAGTWTFAIPVAAPALPVQLVGGFQTLILDPAAPSGLALTAATRLTVIPTPIYAQVGFGGGPTPENLQIFQNTTPGSSTPVTVAGNVGSDFDINTVRLAGFQMFADEASSPFMFKSFASLPVTAFNVNTNPQFKYTRTSQGDFYLIEDNAQTPLHKWTFALVSPGVGPIIIGGSTSDGTGAGGVLSPFKEQIQVHDVRFGYISLVPGPNQRVLLGALDGPTLPGGLDVADVTPSVVPPVLGFAAESLTITPDKLYAIGNATVASPTSGILYSAPLTGALPMTAVTLPGLGTTGLTDQEIRHSQDRGAIAFRAGTSSTSQNLYMIQEVGATPPGTGLAVNLSQFTPGREILAFGDASDGVDNRLAVSDPTPTGGRRLAFITNELNSQGNPSQELYHVDSAGGGAVLITGNVNFDPTITKILEPRWVIGDALLFFAGTSDLTMHLYKYNAGAPSPVPELMTYTGTPPTPTIPFTGSGTINPGEAFQNATGTWYFIFREGQIGTDPVKNVVAIGIDPAVQTYSGLEVLNVTGSEFTGGAQTTNTLGSVATASHLQFQEVGDLVVFISLVPQNPPSNEENLFSFNCTTSQPPLQLTNNTGTTGSEINSVVINPSGTHVAFTDSISGQEAVYVARVDQANSAAVIFTLPPGSPSGVLTDGALTWISDTELLISYGELGGTNVSTVNPTNANLLLIETDLRIVVTVDPTPQANWLFR